MQSLSNPKNIFSLLIVCIAVVFYFNFVSIFKTEHVDSVVLEYEKLSTAYNRAQDKLSLDALKTKKNQLTLQELNVMENFVPIRLKSGTFVYNLAQFANQNRLLLKNIQYNVSDSSASNGVQNTKDKRLIMNFTVEGRYEDFARWMSTVENANTLVTVENVRGVKSSRVNDNITFNVKLVAYALDID